MKATAIAPSNIAFIKYWGKTDEILRLPENGSISINLDNLLTTTTVDFSENYKTDEVSFNGSRPNNADRIIKHLDRIRNLAGVKMKARVVTINNFPTAAGIASSASGFAALTVATAAALNLNLSEKDLSILARQGSGSACRSIPSGFVEWLDGNTSDTSYAVSLYPPDHWDIVDVVAIVSDEQKKISTSAGQRFCRTSPFFATRLANLGNKIENIKTYLANRDFQAFGELIEAEALELMAILITSTPALIYWHPETIKLIKNIIGWRTEGLSVYFTEDAGQNLHIIIERKNLEALLAKLEEVEEIKKLIINKPGRGTTMTPQHLF